MHITVLFAALNMGNLQSMTPVQECIDFIFCTCHFWHVDLVKVMYVAKTRFMQRGRWLTIRVLGFEIHYHLDGAEGAGCFAMFVFLVSLDCCVALPYDTTGLSAVCDCVFSWSYSLTFLIDQPQPEALFPKAKHFTSVYYCFNPWNVTKKLKKQANSENLCPPPLLFII